MEFHNFVKEATKVGNDLQPQETSRSRLWYVEYVECRFIFTWLQNIPSLQKKLNARYLLCWKRFTFKIRIPEYWWIQYLVAPSKRILLAIDEQNKWHEDCSKTQHGNWCRTCSCVFFGCCFFWIQIACNPVLVMLNPSVNTRKISIGTTNTKRYHAS